jgi:hypothetical protein
MAPHPGTYLYIVSAALFILSLKWMNTPATARRGVFAGEAGMLIAVVATLVAQPYLQLGMDSGGLLHRHGGRYPHRLHHADDRRSAADRHVARLRRAGRGAGGHGRILSRQSVARNSAGFVMVALVLETLLGFLTFTGSLMAMGKLQEVLPQRPITYKQSERRQLHAVRHRGGTRRAAHLRPHRHLDLPDFRRPVAAVRRAADHPHRRRRHAHGDRAVELLRRTYRPAPWDSRSTIICWWWRARSMDRRA